MAGRTKTTSTKRCDKEIRVAQSKKREVVEIHDRHHSVSRGHINEEENI